MHQGAKDGNNVMTAANLGLYNSGDIRIAYSASSDGNKRLNRISDRPFKNKNK